MKKPLPPFIKAMKAKADAKKGMHTMPDGKKMKDSAMKMAKGGCVTKMAKGGGIESKGKTKGKMVKMRGC